MDDGNFEEDKTLKHLEGVIEVVIFGALHCKKVVLSSLQFVISHHEPNVFMNKDSFFENTQCGSGMHGFDEVCSLHMSFIQDTFSSQFDFRIQLEYGYRIHS